MYKIQAVVLGVMAVFGSIQCAVFPAGKCNTKNIEPVSIDFHKIVGDDCVCDCYDKLNILYATEIDGIKNIDHIDLVFTPKDKDSYDVVSTKYFKDKTTSKSNYVHSFVDDVILQDGIDAGKPFHFHVYPLAKTNDDAILYYRCADSGRQPVDTRFIAVPAGKPVNDASIKQLLDADKKFNFRGEFYKFPNQLA